MELSEEIGATSTVKAAAIVFEREGRESYRRRRGLLVEGGEGLVGGSITSRRIVRAAAACCVALGVPASRSVFAQTGEPERIGRGPRQPPVPDTVFHWTASASLGSCSRQDPDVGGSGVCAEGTVGVVLLLGAGPNVRAADYRGWRLGFDIGMGGEQGVTQGYADLGLVRSSGGPWFVARTLVGYDWTPLFFTQLGVEGRIAYPIDRVTPGGDGLVEIGTRTGRGGLEVGVRGQVGIDGIANGLFGHYTWTSAVAYGMTGFLRFLLP